MQGVHACSVMLHFICSVSVAVLTGLRECVSCKHCLVAPYLWNLAR